MVVDGERMMRFNTPGLALLPGIQEVRYMTRRKPVSIEVVDEADGRFVVSTYADGTVDREAVDPTKKATRKPRRPQRRLKTEQMDRTRRKSY